jgi:hypothetical protein
MNGKSNALLLALLLTLPTAFLATALIAPAVGQPNNSAWLKIVTDSWNAVPYPGFSTPVNATFLGSERLGFADRYNVTNVCVELYKFKNPASRNPAPLNSWEGPIKAGSPNATGFIKVSWPASWENVTIIVKSKSYQGECIRPDNPFEGIIVYWLTINGVQSFYNKFIGNATDPSPPVGNYTIGDDGVRKVHGSVFNWNIAGPFGSGPVDVVSYATGPITFQVNHNDPYARNAWVARAAYIFKLFHEHTWYGTNDVLTYATIFIYDTDHVTDAGSPQSLIQAAITGDDGQSRYTLEIYPAREGLGPNGKFRNNRLVPIPLQTLRLYNHTPFGGGRMLGGIPAPGLPGGNIEAPHLNATKRVWWETVLTNQTFYVGNVYNGTADYVPTASKNRPLFGAFPANPAINPTHTQGGITGVPAGPLSLALNNTVPAAAGLSTWVTTPVLNVADFNNNTVFYARFCVQDADLQIQHPEVGDKMVGAEVTLNFKTSAGVPYYLAHSIHTTGADGCTNQPHKWPGWLDQFRNFGRFPNGTDWSRRGSLNASYFFNPVDDASPVWRPGGYFERAWGGAWDGPYINAGRNWSALIPEITYMKTRQLTDDPKWGGFEVQVKWKGGSRNGYGGFPVLVDSVRVRNPYGIALTNSTTITGWIRPNVPTANNTVLIKIHSEVLLTNLLGTGKNVRGPVTLMLSSGFPFTVRLVSYDPNTETFDIEVDGYDPFDVTLYIVDNATRVGSLPAPIQSILDVSATIKFHEARTGQRIIRINFGLEPWADVNADGDREDILDIGQDATLDTVGETGVAEVEIWPGPPRTGTIRSLWSMTTSDPGRNGIPFFNDFTGGILFGGTPDPGVFAILSVAARNVVELQPLAPNKASDIALFRTGVVYITADVHDIAYRLVDNLGNPVPAANTAVTLQRGYGPTGSQSQEPEETPTDCSRRTWVRSYMRCTATAGPSSTSSQKTKPTQSQ